MTPYTFEEVNFLNKQQQGDNMFTPKFEIPSYEEVKKTSEIDSALNASRDNKKLNKNRKKKQKRNEKKMLHQIMQANVLKKFGNTSCEEDPYYI